MNSNVVTALVTLVAVYFASSIWKTVVNYRKVSFSFNTAVNVVLTLEPLAVERYPVCREFWVIRVIRWRCEVY